MLHVSAAYIWWSWCLFMFSYNFSTVLPGLTMLMSWMTLKLVWNKLMIVSLLLSKFGEYSSFWNRMWYFTNVTWSLDLYDWYLSYQSELNSCLRVFILPMFFSNKSCWVVLFYFPKVIWSENVDVLSSLQISSNWKF